MVATGHVTEHTHAGYSASDHDHDADYAASGHNHDASYAASGHNHDASYAAAGHTHASGFTAYAAATLGTGVTQRASTSPVGSRTEPGNVVRLRGAIDISGNPSSSTVLLTLDARDHPDALIIHPGVRTGPTGNISCVLLINTSGEVTLTAAPGNGAYLGLDGITFDKETS